MSYEEKTIPSAPMEYPKLDGYENLGQLTFNNQPFELTGYQTSVDRTDFVKIPYVTEEEAREALAMFVSQHCCYGKGPVKDLKFDYIESSDAFRYILQTYTETRTTEYAQEPYSGSPIFITGQPPKPWDITVTPKILFNNEVAKVEIPNTAFVQNCNQCMGVGTTVCHHCNGSGTKLCFACHGKGRISGGVNNQAFNNHHDNHGHHENGNHHHGHHQHGHHHENDQPCHHCHSSGYENCHVCHRVGRVECRVCRSHGKVKKFVQLTVTFQNNQTDFLKQRRDQLIPDELMRKCQAQNVFSEQNIRVYPIDHHPDSDINNASVRLLNEHGAKFSTVKIIAQRHDLNVIPLTICSYTWKDKQTSFQIYGLDRMVYAPDYPKKCCCTIL